MASYNDTSQIVVLRAAKVARRALLVLVLSLRALLLRQLGARLRLTVVRSRSENGRYHSGKQKKDPKLSYIINNDIISVLFFSFVPGS